LKGLFAWTDVEDPCRGMVLRNLAAIVDADDDVFGRVMALGSRCAERAAVQFGFFDARAEIDVAKAIFARASAAAEMLVLCSDSPHACVVAPSTLRSAACAPLVACFKRVDASVAAVPGVAPPPQFSLAVEAYVTAFMQALLRGMSYAASFSSAYFVFCTRHGKSFGVVPVLYHSKAAVLQPQAVGLRVTGTCKPATLPPRHVFRRILALFGDTAADPATAPAHHAAQLRLCFAFKAAVARRATAFPDEDDVAHAAQEGPLPPERPYCGDEAEEKEFQRRWPRWCEFYRGVRGARTCPVA